jgi:hypothetical protein
MSNRRRTKHGYLKRFQVLEIQLNNFEGGIAECASLDGKGVLGIVITESLDHDLFHNIKESDLNHFVVSIVVEIEQNNAPPFIRLSITIGVTAILLYNENFPIFTS